MKPFRIGIIGGMGPAADIRLQQLIREATPATRDQDHVQILCFSNSSIPDRTSALQEDGGERLAKELCNAARLLERGGASVLVMACHTAHARLDDVRRAVSIPVMDLVAETAEEVVRCFPSVRRVGIVATDGTLLSGLYANAFAPYGVECVLPDAVQQIEVMRIVYAIKSGMPCNAASRDLAAVAKHLVRRNAEVILLACTELSLCDVDSFRASVPVLDPLRMAAKRLVSDVRRSAPEMDRTRVRVPPLEDFLRVVMAW